MATVGRLSEYDAVKTKMCTPEKTWASHRRAGWIALRLILRGQAASAGPQLDGPCLTARSV